MHVDTPCFITLIEQGGSFQCVSSELLLSLKLVAVFH